MPAKYVGKGGGRGRHRPSASKAMIPEEHRQFVRPSSTRPASRRCPRTPSGGRRRRPGSTSTPRGRASSRSRSATTGVKHGRQRPRARRPSTCSTSATPPDRMVGGLVGAKQHAERQLALGVDVVVAQGTEAGGHCGEISTMVLVPQVVDAVRAPIPCWPPGASPTVGRWRRPWPSGPRACGPGRSGSSPPRPTCSREVQENLLGRLVPGLRPLAGDDRQAGPPAADEVGRGVGAPRRPRAAAHAPPGPPVRPGGGPLRPGPLEGLRRPPRRPDPRARSTGSAPPATSSSPWSRSGSTRPRSSPT